ncbi:hypothetical protein BFJ70_g12346 [Fusarium oxysporum]|nr:hypothetical protein FOWG_00201 [Fusarium oxysporum f. sp. lycopersici MN25]KAJ4160897.1 hypothetical protein NW765_005742 [Fusarium oxysporum]KAJ4282687.1 hypothetical protein NW764_003700 [Fusarium oxysporum]RKL25300.1 hypothetical protein BFJ70_g12346 [Fusarium oxysporum]
MDVAQIFMNQELFAFQTYHKDADRKWPDDIEAPFPVVPVSDPGPAAISTELPPPSLVPWKELQAVEDGRGPKCAETARQIYSGRFFEHLIHSELDWSLPGRYICRVVDCDFYGHNFKTTHGMKTHLNSRKHLDLDASYALVPDDASPNAVTDTPEQVNLEIATPDLESDQESSTPMTSIECITPNLPARSLSPEPQGYNTILPRDTPPPMFA